MNLYRLLAAAIGAPATTADRRGVYGCLGNKSSQQSSRIVYLFEETEPQADRALPVTGCTPRTLGAVSQEVLSFPRAGQPRSCSEQVNNYKYRLRRRRRLCARELDGLCSGRGVPSAAVEVLQDARGEPKHVAQGLFSISACWSTRIEYLIRLNGPRD